MMAIWALAFGLALAACGLTSAHGFDDEPDELNWDTLGGTVTGFTHFKDYCAAHPDYRARLLAEAPHEPEAESPASVSVTPADFAKGALCEWSLGTAGDVPCIETFGGHHGRRVRTGVDIPADGVYRVWVRYWHEKGSIGSFVLEIGDGRLADCADPAADVVQDVFSCRFDFAEFARRSHPLPNHKDEPTGFIWEASPLVRLTRGRHAISLAGLTHEGPYASRKVAQVVLTQVPLATPDQEQTVPPELAALWVRRPAIRPDNARFLPLWRTWRAAFFADLLAGKLTGVEAGRLAGQVYYDETSNLLGTPRQVADEKAARARFWKTLDPQEVPSGEGLVLAPHDASRPLTVWRAADPWIGFSHVRAPAPEEGLAPLKVELREGEAESLLFFVRNNADQPQTVVPQVQNDAAGLVRWRVVAEQQTGGFGWQPMPLLARRELVVPPFQTVGVWVTVDGRPGFASARPVLRLGEAEQTLDVVRLPPLPAETPVPLVYGWSTPYRARSCWELYRELGVNVVTDGLVPKAEAEKYGVKLTLHLNDGNADPAHVKATVARFERQGYAANDWAWSFMDEPGPGVVDQWVALAQKMRAVDPRVRVWVNPGEASAQSVEACLKMLPYVNLFCPYCNHWTVGKNLPAYYDQLQRKGAHFDILMGYTTPCFGEKAPSAPLDLLGLSDFALACKLDGWAFFALAYGFTYSNSVWDEANAYLGDQCVNLYPGAAYRTLSTRSAEAIREAVRRYRRGWKHESGGAVPAVELYPLSQVRISDASLFAPAVKADVAFVQALDVDRLLAPFRREAGLPKKAETYGDWERTGIAGHTLGHYLSALADLIASGADADGDLRRRLDHIVDELAACQAATGGRLDGIPGGAALWRDIRAGNVETVFRHWAPWYNVHKTFAGLRDAYEQVGNEKALAVLRRLGDWTIELTAGLTDRQRQRMLDQEYGGMNETFADLFALTKETKYLEAARLWEHRAVFDPLYRHEDRLTGLHANTQIPKFTGLARTAQVSRDAARWDAADFAWRTIVTRRSVAYGGNSSAEHFHELDSFAKMMVDRTGPETCNTYNMLRLTERLFEHEPKAEYAAYYERALFNHILPSINVEHPGFVYHTPVRPGHYRVYSVPATNFWCCVGTGMENPGRYGRFIYAHEGADRIYVNLFVDSELKGLLRQRTDFPTGGTTTLTFLRPFTGTVCVREGDHYAEHKGAWKAGDEIRAARAMDWHVEMLPDGSAWGAILRGPIVMGKACGTDRQDGLFAGTAGWDQVAKGPYADPARVETRIAGAPLDTTGLVPFYTLHECRYQIYWEFVTAEEAARNTAARAAAARSERERDRRTRDRVSPGEQQSETDHGLTTAPGGETGYHEGRHWRHGSRFAYVLDPRGATQLALEVTYWGGDRDRTFDIFANGVRIGTEKLNGAYPDAFFSATYPIPDAVLKSRADGKIEIAFAAVHRVAGGVFDIRLLTP